VNDFLEDKALEVKTQQASSLQPFVRLSFKDGSSSDGLGSLSSGERQIVTLIYAVTHMSQQDVVLIDEPEISLHIDWQRKLLTKMASQLPTQQVIVCTHAPPVARDHPEKFKRIALNSTDKSKWVIDEQDNKQNDEQDNKQDIEQADTTAASQNENFYDEEPLGEEDFEIEEE
jgi:predicted ATPase